MWQFLKDFFTFIFENRNDTIDVMLPSKQPLEPLQTPPTTTKTPIVPPTKLVVFCNEIQAMEGWTPGSTSFTHSNPGNLRCPPLNVLADSCVNGFCHFKDEATGMQALINVTKSCAEGLSVTYNTAAKHFGVASGADLNLYQYFTIRDPASDNNQPDALAERFGTKLGVNPSTFLMKQLLDS
jgi:hypothetical protein